MSGGRRLGISGPMSFPWRMGISGTRSLLRGGYVQGDGYVQSVGMSGCGYVQEVGMSGEMSTNPPPSTDMGPERVGMSRGWVPNAPKHGTRRGGCVCQGAEYPTTPRYGTRGGECPLPTGMEYHQIRLASGRYPSYWNAFFLCLFFL